MINQIRRTLEGARSYFFDAGSKHFVDYEPTPARIQKQLISRATLAGWLPYNAYLESERIFVNEHGLGFALEVLPQTGADLEMVNILTSLYSAFPPNTGVQVQIYGSPRIEHILRPYADQRVRDDDAEEQALQYGRPARNSNIFRQFARERYAFYVKGNRESLVKSANYVLRDFRAVLSCSIPGNADDLSRVEEVVRLRDGIRSSLVSSGFGNREWSPDDLINWLANIYNPERVYDEPSDLAYDPGRLIRSQIIAPDTCVVADKSGIMFSKGGSDHEFEMRNFSVKNYPERFALWDMRSLVGDLYQSALQYPCPFLITVGAYLLDPETARSKAYMHAARATQNAQSYFAKLRPDIAKKKEDWDYALKSIDNGLGLVELYHQLTLLAPYKEMARAEFAAKSIWRGRGFEIISDMFMQQQAMLSTMPMSLSTPFFKDLKSMSRITTKTTSNAAHMSPLVAEWKGTKNGVLVFGARSGQLMKIDIFDNDKEGGNFNVAIAGEPGSGKSVLMQEMAASYLGCGAKVFVIDSGRSFEKLCKRVGGRFIDFAAEANLCFNPFAVLTDVGKDEMALLKPLLLQMIGPTTPLTDFQSRYLDRVIQTCWLKHYQNTTFFHIAEMLKNGCEELNETVGQQESGQTCDPEIVKMGHQLWPYTVDGQYGKYFNGANNLSFDEDFIVLELEALQAYPDLQAVILMILMFYINKDMYKRDRNRKKLVFFDEAWRFLGGSGSQNAMSQFVEELYRQVRKYNGAVISATQSITDYFQSTSAETAYKCSGWKLILRQTKEAVERMDHTGQLVLDAYAKRQILSLRTEDRTYSEVYLSSPLGRGIGRLFLDPKTQLLLSSKAADYNAVQAYLDQGMSIAGAVNAVLANRTANSEIRPMAEDFGAGRT